MKIRSVYLIPLSQYFYAKEQDGTEGKTVEFKEATRNGEMALVPTIQTFIGGRLDWEADRSHCVVFYE